MLYLCWLIEYIIEKGWKEGFIKHLNGLTIGGLLMISYPLFLLYTHGIQLYMLIYSLFLNSTLLYLIVLWLINLPYPAIYTIVIFNFIFFTLLDDFSKHE